MGGFKAGISDAAAKSSGKNPRLTPENTLKDLLAVYGVTNDRTVRSGILFMQRALEDQTISASTKLSWLNEEPKEITEEPCQS